MHVIATPRRLANSDLLFIDIFIPHKVRVVICN